MPRMANWRLRGDAGSATLVGRTTPNASKKPWVPYYRGRRWDKKGKGEVIKADLALGLQRQRKHLTCTEIGKPAERHVCSLREGVVVAGLCVYVMESLCRAERKTRFVPITEYL